VFPLAVRWQAIRNHQRAVSWESNIEHCMCNRTESMGWWRNLLHGGSPWSDPDLENRRVDAARFQAPFMRGLEGLVRSHPDIFLRDMKSSFDFLMPFPDFDASWPHSPSSLSRILKAIGFSAKNFE